MRRIKFSQMSIDVFTKLEEIVIGAYKGSDLDMFYFDTPRRNELMRKVTEFLPKGALILDAGCAPGFTSLALKLLGFTVFSLDIEPEPYKEILERYGCKVIKADLERGCIPLPTESMDGVIFTEVLEHLNPYYISSTMCELNRVLKTGGFLFLSTPNIVSIGKRVKAIFGRNPIGQTHVKEYTMDEVKELVNTHGFHIEECYYSLAYDRIPYKAESKDYLVGPFRAMFKYPSKENLFKVLVLPLVYIKPSFRATIFIIGRKRFLSQRIPAKRF